MKAQHAEKRGRAAQEALPYAEAVADTVREPLLVLDADLRVKWANATFYETFGTSPEEVEGRLFHELGKGRWNLSGLQEQLKEVMPGRTWVSGFKVEYRRAEGGPARKMLLSARRFDHLPLVLLSIEDVTEREETESILTEMLRQEHRAAQMYLDLAGVFFLALDREGHVTLINQKGCEILGYSEEEVLGKNWFDHFLPERTREEIWVIHRSVLRGELEGDAFHENLILRKNGEERLIAWHNAVIRGKGGAVQGTLSSGKDVTEYRQTKRALEVSQRQLLALFENALDAFLLADDDARYVDCNPAACSLLGYEHGELLQETVATLSAGGHREGFEEQWKAFLASGTQSGEYQVRRKDGRVIDVEYRTVAGVLPGLHLSVLRDITERKQAEEALRESEARFRSTFEQAAVGMAHVAPDGRWLLVNERLCEITGYPRDELLGLTFQDITHPEDLEPDLVQVQRLLAGEISTYSMEKRYIRKEGSFVWIFLTVSLVRTPEGEPQYFICVIQDITEQKQAEEALRQSEERFRNLFESSPDAIFVEDFEGDILDVNPAACRLHNTDRDTLLGLDVRVLVPPDQREAAMQDFEKLVRGEVSYLHSYSWTVHRHAVPVEIRANRFAYAGKDAILLIVRDISERIEAMNALEESEARTRAILETTVDAVITIDERGIIESFNPAAERIFGYRAEEVVGRNISMLMPAPYQKEHDGYLRRYLETGEKRIIGVGREVFGQRKDGTTFPIDLAVSEVPLEGQRLFTGIIRDISDRRRLEQAVLHISEEERQRIGRDLHDGLGSLLTGVAMGAQGVAQALRRGKPVEPEDLEQIAGLVEEAAAQVQAIARGLNPVKVEAEGLPAALQELAGQVRRMARLSCTFEQDEPLPELNGPTAMQLYWIAQEAAFNAAKHARAEHIRIRLTVEQGHLVLRVRDDGVGLPEERPDEGAGLHIMRYRANLIGAVYSLRGLPEGGTLVTCSLPLTRTDPSSAEALSERR